MISGDIYFLCERIAVAKSARRSMFTGIVFENMSFLDVGAILMFLSRDLNVNADMFVSQQAGVVYVNSVRFRTLVKHGYVKMC